MPIINTDFGFYAKVCVYLYSRKIFGILLSNKKRKNKTKSFCLARSWKSAGFLRRTNHSRTVVINGKKTIYQPQKCVI